jgi:hypothetical protein
MRIAPSSLLSRRGLVALLAFIPALASAAVTLENSRVQVGGFFSQGYLYSSNNNYPTANKGGTWDFREMAANVSTTFGSRLRVGGQVFAQRLGALGDDKVKLDWAVADYNFSSLLGVRVGRVKYPKGLYGEALDLDVVRPFVFLPGAVYSPILRDFSASFDGAMIYGSVNVGRGSIDYKVFHGDIPMQREQGVAEFYNNAGVYTAAGASQLAMDRVQGGQVMWNTPISGLKTGLSYSAFTNLSTDGPFIAAPALNVHSNIDRFSWFTVSTEYSRGNWTFASEWQRTGGDLSMKTPVAPAALSRVGWDGWYISAARRINDRFEIGSYYGNLKSRYPSATSTKALRRQLDYALSLRVDVSEHVLFKIEGHYIDGTYQTFNTTRIPNPSATRKDSTTLFTAKTTLSF